MAMGVHRRSKIEFTLIHNGFAGLTLDAHNPARDLSPDGARSIENQLTTKISFSLADLETDFVAQLIALCEPFFILFDFTQIKREVYEELAKPFFDLQRS